MISLVWRETALDDLEATHACEEAVEELVLYRLRMVLDVNQRLFF